MKKRLKYYLLGIALIGFACVSLSSCDLSFDSDSPSNNKTQVISDGITAQVEAYKKYKDKEYEAVVEQLESQGFHNITIIRDGNLITGWVSTENTVREMSINGDSKFKAGSYDTNAEIIIHVHSYDGKCPEGHDLSKVTKKDATCQEYGIAFDAYYCSSCEKYYTDSKGNGLLAKDDVLLEKKNHTLNHIDGAEATCTQEGMKEHYECSVCHHSFLDEECTTPIDNSSCVIGKKSHTIVIDSAVDPTPTSTGLSEGSHCDVCHTIIKEQEIVNWIGSDVERAKAAELEQVFPVDYSKRAAVTAFTNMFADDVWLNDNEKDPTKFHTYSDTLNNPEKYYWYILNTGTYSYQDVNTWHIDKMKLKSYGYYVEHIISLDVKLENGTYYVLNMVDARDVAPGQKTSYDGDALAKAVPYDLIKDDRVQANEDAINYSSRLSYSDAFDYLEYYLAHVYPDYKATVHRFVGVHNAYQEWDGSWYIDVDVTFKNAAGNTYEYRVQCTVKYDKTMKSFVKWEKS